MTEKHIPIDAACQFCRWCSYPFSYHYADRAETVPLTYKCQRRAPVATGGMMSPAWTIWPEVRADDRCGDFELRVSA